MCLFNVHERVIHLRYSNRYSNNACVAKKHAICSCVKFLSRRRFRDATGSRMRSRNVARIIVRVGRYQIIINRQCSEYHLRRMKVDQRRGRSVEKKDYESYSMCA